MTLSQCQIYSCWPGKTCFFHAVWTGCKRIQGCYSATVTPEDTWQEHLEQCFALLFLTIHTIAHVSRKPAARMSGGTVVLLTVALLCKVPESTLAGCPAKKTSVTFGLCMIECVYASCLSCWALVSVCGILLPLIFNKRHHKGSRKCKLWPYAV